MPSSTYVFIDPTSSIRQCRASPGAWVRETRAGSGAGGHVGGEDVVRIAVQVLARSVVAHGGSRVGVPGSDLDVAEVDAGIEHGRDEGMPEHMRMGPGDLDAGGLSEVVQAAGS